MKRIPLVALLLLGLSPSRAAELDPMDPSTALLTSIDITLTSSLLTDILGASASDQLLAMSADLSQDVGLRLRATRSLALFASPQNLAYLRDDIDTDLGFATSGTKFVLRAAAIESLGVIGDDTDVARLVVMLEVEASRDIREAAARALLRIGSPTAIAPLRDRFQREASGQVRLAISDALRVLEAL